MGTVVEKIRYIAGTKSAIRSAILKKGVEVGDEVTFRAYAEKIAEIEGGQSAAAYVFENATMAKSYPVDEMTEAGWKTFPFNYVDDLEGFKASEYEFATYCTAYGGGWIPWFDNNFSTSKNLAQPKYFKFGKPVLLKKIKIAGDAQTLKIYATNEADYLGNTSLMTLAKEVEVPSSAASLIELEVDADAPYMYYMFDNDSNYSGIKELRWEVVGGNVSCALSSANMTPEVRVYLTDYMRLITQPFYCEGKVIPSQTLVMKPYEEGGNLINYTDDGSAVDLKMYLLTGTDKPALYLLSPDDTFERPEGYADMTKTADLSLPAHICKKEIIGDFSQPALLANGTLGGDSFAVKADSEYSDPYRAAWKAFDGNTVLADTGNDQWHSYSGQPHWLAFYNPYPLKVSSVTVYNGGDKVLPLDWKFQVSDNGTTWTDVASGTNTNTTAGSSWSFDIASPGWHKYHRFYTSSGQGRDGEYLGLTELQITALERAERWVMGGA